MLVIMQRQSAVAFLSHFQSSCLTKSAKPLSLRKNLPSRPPWHGPLSHWVGEVVSRIDPRYFRPTEVETLLGDPAKAKLKLGWRPEITVQQMCAEMVAADLEEAQKQSLLKKHGFQVTLSVE